MHQQGCMAARRQRSCCSLSRAHERARGNTSLPPPGCFARCCWPGETHRRRGWRWEWRWRRGIQCGALAAACLARSANSCVAAAGPHCPGALDGAARGARRLHVAAPLAEQRRVCHHGRYAAGWITLCCVLCVVWVLGGTVSQTRAIEHTNRAKRNSASRPHGTRTHPAGQA